MKMYSAFVELTDDRHTPIYLHLEIGGQPRIFALTLRDAIAGVRGHLHNRRLLLLIASAIKQKRLRSATCYTYEDPLPEIAGFHFRYLIEIDPRKPTYVTAHAISDGGTETQIERSPIELFITKQLRGLRKPKGRTPHGYDSREEYVEAYNARSTPDKSPHYAPSLEQRNLEIEHDRKKRPLPRLNLEGVTEYTREEYIQRRKSAKRPKRIGRREK